MPVVDAAIAVVGVLCVLDMLMTFGAIRRLREHTELLRALSVPDVPVIGLAIGESPGAFSAVTAGGQPVSNLDGYRLIAFFSTSCSICPERVAPFAHYVAQHRLAQDAVLAVVVGPVTEPPPYLDQLAEVAQVCVEGHEGELGNTFKVVGFPAFCLLDSGGVVTATNYDPAALPEPVAAR
jgi:hypothetical protein